MIQNSNTINSQMEGQGQGYFITPEVLLWRSVIVRAMMDAIDIDIHAWGISRRRIVEDADACHTQTHRTKTHRTQTYRTQTHRTQTHRT